jgi:hypothetical protein
MIVNRKNWKLEVCLSSVELDSSFELENARIPGVSFKGALRCYLGSLVSAPELMEQLFGSEDTRGQMHISDLRIDTDAGRPEFRHEAQVKVNRYTGSAEELELHWWPVVRASTFRGELSLRNGGYYTSLAASSAITKALKNLKLGLGVRRGDGCIESARMVRSFGNDNDRLNPVEAVLRDGNLRLIVELTRQPHLVQYLEWRDLERVIALCYEELGFDVELTQSSGDGGKDIVLRFNLLSRHKLGAEYYIEIKHWNQPVGPGAIRKLSEVKLKDAADGAVLLSTSGFTESAKHSMDNSHGVILGDLSIVRNLCRFFIASRKNSDFLPRTLEEIVSPTTVAQLK